MAYLIWLDSLRILRISFPLNSNSLVRAFIFSWRCCTSLSKSEMWCSLCLTSSCRSVILHTCAHTLLWKIDSSEKFSTIYFLCLRGRKWHSWNVKCNKSDIASKANCWNQETSILIYIKKYLHRFSFISGPQGTRRPYKHISVILLIKKTIPKRGFVQGWLIISGIAETITQGSHVLSKLCGLDVNAGTTDL